KSMKKILIFLFALFVLFPVPVFAEKISNFEVRYILSLDGVISVTEIINYDFGTLNRHGIYRYIPYIYNLDNGQKHRINISGISVKDLSGRDYKYENFNENNNIVIKIGDPNRKITGQKSYVITYQVKGGIRYLDNNDEFFWNVNGFGWDVPINNVKATVQLPTTINDSDIEIACWQGVYGSTTECESMQGGNTLVFTATELGPKENLTIDVGVPPGTFEVTDAGFMGTGLSLRAVILMVSFGFLTILMTFIFMLRHWWKFGRDPKGRGTIVVEYSPPDGLTPIEVGTLLDNRVDSKDMSAEIIYLATQGYLKIIKEKRKILGTRDYILVKLKEFSINEKSIDATLFNHIFGSVSEVKVSELKKDFYPKVRSIKGEVHNKLVSDGYFRSSSLAVVTKYIGIASGVFILGIVVLFMSSFFNIGNVISFVVITFTSMIVAGIISIFGLMMPARTEKGVLIKEHVLGFKEYMKMVESERIKFHNAPEKNPEKFEEYLPYAMVLGVEKEWAKQFEGIYKAQPGWYQDPAGGILVPLVLVNDINNFSSLATSSMFSPPSSSGSGLGGGGSSGGGFGGGGGGSW
ncbi:DUF2207 domain-containing protein, partial [Patescibacteria group bacterium]|nr:DUF2207 domain-containing protein [Patescibacteria group bacterium]